VSIRRAVSAVLTLALLGFVSLSVIQAFPGIVGADLALTVQSGSMEPAIGVGSVVFVQDVPAEHVEEGDVITYQDDGGNYVTHRAIRKFTAGPDGESIQFRTKGDANDAADPEPVYRGDVVGRVMFTVPFIGYVIAFADTGYGFMLLVWGPVLALVFSELVSLYRAGMASSESDGDETTGT
jgi:signal peptidase